MCVYFTLPSSGQEEIGAHLAENCQQRQHYGVNAFCVCTHFKIHVSAHHIRMRNTNGKPLFIVIFDRIPNMSKRIILH